MSEDFKLKHRCPHHVRREWVPIQPDLRSIYPLEAPSSNDVELRWNGHEVPRSGIGRSAKTLSLATGPFRIEAGENDEVRLAVDGGPVQALTLPPGEAVSLDRVLSELDASLDGVNVASDRRGFSVETEGRGRTRSLHFDEGSAHRTLGLPYRRHIQGDLVFPGWGLEVKPEANVTRDRFILLEEPTRADDNVFEVSYFTRREDCRRCQGIGIEFDLRYDEKGMPLTATGEELLLQEVEKITLTLKGSNIFHEWYGTSISDLVGEKVTPGAGVVTAQMRKDISDALERYKDVKSQQKRYQDVPPEEFLLKVLSIEVEREAGDPTGFNIRVRLQNKAGDVGSVTNTIGISSGDGGDFQLIA